MKDVHIIRLLEESPMSGLSSEEMELILAHTAACSECLRAYEASQAAALMLKERASLPVEPSPFFQTRVMAAIREKNLSAETPGFWKVWQTAQGLVASMAATVVILIALTFYFDNGQTQQSFESGSGFSEEGIEMAILDPEGFASEGVSYSQVLDDLYEIDSNRGGENGKQ